MPYRVTRGGMLRCSPCCFSDIHNTFTLYVFWPKGSDEALKVHQNYMPNCFCFSFDGARFSEYLTMLLL